MPLRLWHFRTHEARWFTLPRSGLLGYEVEAGDRLNDRILHLESIIHFEEPRLARRRVEQHLDRPGVAVTNPASLRP